MERITNAKISLRTLLVHTELNFCHSSEDGKGSKLEKNGTKFRFAVNFSFFVCRYRNLSFTKNPEKYIKYTVEEVEMKLKTFFDVSA